MKLTKKMLEAAATASLKWPKTKLCQHLWERSPKPWYG